MDRVKRPIKKIENNAKRQEIFSKRGNGLIKKAYELSVLCDIDIGLIMFSPSGRISHFSGRRRIEDVLERYINHLDNERGSEPNVDKAFLASVVSRLRCEGDGPVPQANSGAPNPTVEKLQQDIAECRQQLQLYTDCLSFFEHNPRGPPSILSLSRLNACEEFLKHSLARVLQKKSCMQQAQEQGMVDDYLLSLDHPPLESINFSNRDLPMQMTVDTSMPLRDQVKCDPSGEGAAVRGESAVELLPYCSVGDAPAAVNGESVDEQLNDSDDASAFVNRGSSADEQLTDGSARDAPVAVSGGGVDELLPGGSASEQ